MRVYRSVMTYHGPGSEVGITEQNISCNWHLSVLGRDYVLWPSRIRPADIKRFHDRQAEVDQDPE